MNSLGIIYTDESKSGHGMHSEYAGRYFSALQTSV